MAIIYYIVILTSIFIGSLKSDCVDGTSIGCYRTEMCYKNQCYPAYGPCLNGACENGFICIADNCLNMLATTTTYTITKNPTCMDYNVPGLLSECPLRAYLCNNFIYYNLMTKLCPRTCNRCPGAISTVQPPIPYCSDRTGADGKSNCATFAHLCQNLLYNNVMRQQCPRTCKFC